MNISLLTSREILGLFELDGVGKVLYYRTDSAAQEGPMFDTAGLNFYDEVANFKNVDEFRRNIVEFTRGLQAAHSFEFDCQYDGCSQPVRVLLARISERDNRSNTKSVLVHIRKGKNFDRPNNLKGGH